MVHKFINNGIKIAFDVESGSIFVLDEISYDLIGENSLNNPKDFEDKYTKEELTETLSELKSLIDEGILYADPVENLTLPPQNFNVKALCLHVAHDCNLRCSYCFASQGDFKGNRSIMSLETAKKAIDFVIANSHGRYNIEIDFFGGEPLMNYEVVKDTVEYARSLEDKYNKHFKFTITTNGLLLNEDNKKWLDDNMDNIVLSHDGRPEVNNRMRKTISGDGSFDVITPNILEMAAMREGQKDYYVRGTYTGENKDFAEDVLFLNNLGVKSISIEPVIAAQTDSYRLKEEDIPELVEEYNRLGKLSLDHDFSFYHFNTDFGQGPCLYKRVSGCGAGTDYLAITPEGKIFPCHQFVSRPDFCLGSLDEGIIKPEIADNFKEANLLNKETCQDCWCKYLCGGGCHANNYEFSNSLKVPYELACALERARMEVAIMLYLKKNN